MRVSLGEDIQSHLRRRPTVCLFISTSQKEQSLVPVFPKLFLHLDSRRLCQTEGHPIIRRYGRKVAKLLQKQTPTMMPHLCKQIGDVTDARLCRLRKQTESQRILRWAMKTLSNMWSHSPSSTCNSMSHRNLTRKKRVGSSRPYLIVPGCTRAYSQVLGSPRAYSGILGRTWA